MEYNSGVSMLLPDSIGLLENDFDDEDHEDIHHEESRNQNEIVELIMAAFEGHDEPFDGEEEEDEDDDGEESLNTSGSSHHSGNDHGMLNSNNNNNNNNNNGGENYLQQHELFQRNRQPLFSTPAVSTPPPLALPPTASTDVHRFDGNNHTLYTQHVQYPQFEENNSNEQQDIPFNSNAHHYHNTALVRYQNSNHQPAAAAAVQYFDSLPTIDLVDPMQAQYMYQTSSSSSSTNTNDQQNQLNKLRILCNVKDRKIGELENRCAAYFDKHSSDIRALKHKLELNERAKYDCEQRSQSITKQCEDLMETNNQLQRTIKDAELRVQQLESAKAQLEKKLDDAESLIDSLHRKLNELQRFETIARTQQDCELVLASTREKHEQELIAINEKLQIAQMNLQEKHVEVDELRVQLEAACKNNEKAIFERMETISHLNQQLHDCQRQYTDLLTTKSLETFNQTDTKRQLTRLTEDKEKLEHTCQELQSEIRTLRERLGLTEHEVNTDLFGITSVTLGELSSLHRQIVPNSSSSPYHHNTTLDDGTILDSGVKSSSDESLLNENQHLKERIDEFASNEQHLIEINKELQRKIQQFEESNSNSSDETIGDNIHIEQILILTKEIDHLKRDYTDLQEKYDYEKHELQTIVEQLREDAIDLDKTKQLYIDVCREKNAIEDKLRAKFEHDIKIKLDDLRQTLEKDNEKVVEQYKQDMDKLQEDNQILKRQRNNELEQQERKLHDEIERLKVNYEKNLNEMTIEIDRLRANDDGKSRLIYIEKEFEQLKHEYYDLNLKQKELLNNCTTLENENQNLLRTIEQIEQENIELKQTETKLFTEMKHLHETINTQKQQLLLHTKESDENQIHFKQDIESLKIRISNYENAVSQYEEYRLKLENNLQKITQQRDTHKMDLRLVKEMLGNKETEINQMKARLEEFERRLTVDNQTAKERSTQYEATVTDLKRHINQYEQQIHELTQSRTAALQEKEKEYREKLSALDSEKCQFEQLLQESNRALNLADSHLKQEIEKIKISLEQEYKRRYERDHKQHQHEMNQLRQQLTNEFEQQRANYISVTPTTVSTNAAQEIEEMKKMYRTEIDRLYRENVELNQQQAKLIDGHQKQMQTMKNDLDDGYNKVIDEFQREQTRLQTRYEQIKHEFHDAQQIIEQLKTKLTEMNTVHFDDRTKIKEAYTSEKFTTEQDNRNRQENLQNRVEHLVKLLEQANETLNQERMIQTRKENEYQQTISSLQKKIAEMIKQHTKAMDEVKRELHQERLNTNKHATSRPITVPEFVQTDMTSNDMKTDYLATVEKLRVGIAHYLDNVDQSIKKQIQSELLRSRNSMIKEIRRELFEKMTHALRSQGVPDTMIDMQVFELDRLLVQMAQDCLDSLSASSPSSYSTISSNSSIITTPLRQQQQQQISQSSRSICYDSSTSSPPPPHVVKSKSTFVSSNEFIDQTTTPLRKSLECLHVTPSIHKQPAPLAPHYHTTLDNNRRPKSASNILIANQNGSSTLSPRTHKFQRQTHRNLKMKTYRSEDDIMVAMQRHEEHKIETPLTDDEDTVTLCENDEIKEQIPQPNVRALARQFEQKTNSLPDSTRSKLSNSRTKLSSIPTTINDHQTIHFATAHTIINEQQEQHNGDDDDDDELTWPRQQLPATPSSSGGGGGGGSIKKFVRNGLKLFSTQSQQHKQRTGK